MPHSPIRVAVATNEPWGTYHFAPVAAMAAARGVELVQVVPDLSALPHAFPQEISVGPQIEADLLVINGLSPWPVEVVRANPNLPVAFTGVAYLGAQDATAGVEDVVARLSHLTATSPADVTTLRGYLNLDELLAIEVTGVPALDHKPQAIHGGHVLILTSVSEPTKTGGSGSGHDLLRRIAAELTVRGERVIVRRHPREPEALWGEFENDMGGSVTDAAAGAKAVIGVPGTSFAAVASLGVPLVGVLERETVPTFILDLCGKVIRTETDLEAWGLDLAAVEASSAGAVHEAVGPVGVASAAIVDSWLKVVHEARIV